MCETSMASAFMWMLVGLVAHKIWVWFCDSMDRDMEGY